MATFLLVHGTFAKSANWPALQDSVAEAACEAGESAFFQQVPWSGKNRAAAREAAASAILKSVQDIRSNSNNEKVFLIGHSHGGSAIAYFLKEHPEAAKTLAGCAFLSTPFVAIRPKTDPRGLIVGLFFFPYAAFIGLWNGIAYPHYNSSSIEEIEKHLNTPIMNDAPAYLFGLFVSCAIAALVWLAWTFVKRATAPRQVEQSIRQQTADIPAGNYLFLRCSGDEAAAALSAAQFIAWLDMKSSKILGLLSRPFFFNPRRQQPISWGSIFWSLFFGSVIFVLVSTIGYGSLSVLPGLHKSGFEYFLLPKGLFRTNDVVLIMIYIGRSVGKLVSFIVVCLLFLSLLAVFLIVFTQAITSWLFGWTRLSTGFLVELAIEPLPFGEHSLINIDWTAGSTGLSGMVHSWTYAHPTALRHLRNWVKASLLFPSAHRAQSGEDPKPQELQPADSS